MAEEVKDLLIPHLVFTKDWRNRDHFPTYEPSEDQVRNDMQYLYEEIKKYLNDNVAGTLCEILQAHMNKAVVTKVEFTEASVDGDDITLKLEVTTSDDKVATTECLLKDLAEAMREELGSGIKSVDYDAEARAWVFTYADGRVDRVALPKEETGIALVSLDTPGAEHTPATGFVVGQQWLRPAFTVENHALENWTLTKGSVETTKHTWVFTADGSTGTFSAEQALNGIGTTGQKVYVMLLADRIAGHQTALSVSLNGASHDLKGGGGMYEATLNADGNLLIVVEGSWSYAASAATVTLKNLVVVNSDAIEAAAVDCKPLSDWPGFIETYAPFEQVIMPRTMFVQTAPGNWVPTDFEVLPVNRGGTGANSSRPNSYLKTDETGAYRFLDQEEFASNLSMLRYKTGSYVGDETARTIELGVEPRLIYLYPTSGPTVRYTHGYQSADSQLAVMDNPILLANGAAKTELWSKSVSYSSYGYQATVKLSGSKLTFSSAVMSENATNHWPSFGNRSGETYNWIALY